MTEDSNPGGLRPSSLPLRHGGSHNFKYGGAGKKHLVSLKLECQGGVRAGDHIISKQAAQALDQGPSNLSTGFSHVYENGSVLFVHIVSGIKLLA